MRLRAAARRTARTLGALALLATAGCAADAPQDFLQPEGPIARQIDGLWDVTYWMAVAVFIVVEGVLLIALVKFRAGRRTDDPAQVHGNTRLEIAWTILPAVLLAGLAVPTIGTIFALAQPDEDRPMNITVTGLRWWWDYEYTDYGFTTANELHIPTGRSISLRLESKDVIHSYWVPKLAGKQDVVPGRTNFLKLEADTPGPYMGQCAEFCGASHANMRLRVIAHEPQDFERWVSEQRRPPVVPTDALAQRGKELFEGGACIGCHVIEGVSEIENTIGPNLTHVGSRETFAGAIFPLTEENLAEWLANPPAMKPGSLMPDLGLSDEDIEALVAYLMTLT